MDNKFPGKDITIEDLKKRLFRNNLFDSKNYFYVNLTHNVYLSYLVERGFLGIISSPWKNITK